MQILNDWGTALSASLAQIVERVTLYLPSILGAFLLLLVGWVVARVLRSMAIRSAVLIDRLLARFTSRTSSERSRLPQSSRLYGATPWARAAAIPSYARTRA